MKAKPSVLRDELPRLRQRGFQRVRIAGEIKSLDEPRLVPNGAAELAVELVLDRLVLNADQRSRLADSLELAFREGQNRALVLVQKTAEAPWREIALSQSLACTVCGDVFEPLTPRSFFVQSRRGRLRDLRRARAADDVQRRAADSRSGEERARGRAQAVAHRRKESHHQAQRPAQAAGRAAALRPGRALAGPAGGDAEADSPRGGGAALQLQAAPHAARPRRCRSRALWPT